MQVGNIENATKSEHGVCIMTKKQWKAKQSEKFNTAKDGVAEAQKACKDALAGKTPSKLSPAGRKELQKHTVTRKEIQS